MPPQDIQHHIARHEFWEVCVNQGHESVDIFIRVDVGKSNHHAVAIDRKGKRLLDRAWSQDEAKLRAIIKAVAGKRVVLLVADQQHGALPVAAATAEGIMGGYIQGLAMRRIAALRPGDAKTGVLAERSGPARRTKGGAGLYRPGSIVIIDKEKFPRALAQLVAPLLGGTGTLR